jgi:ATP-dependent RNA helicase DDX54/DBP10
MVHRAVSPALSENEFDITNGLLGASDESDGGEESALALRPAKKSKNEELLDLGSLLDLGAENDDDDDGDEAFIASQQAASNRKSANLKGRTVKKGGGFQAMGNTLPFTNTKAQ